MKLIKLKPTTNGSRHQIKIDKSLLVKNNRIFKSTLSNFNSANGRSLATGNITSWHRGGGQKHLYRKLDLNNSDKSAIVLGVSYDPNRSAFISTNFDLDNRSFFNTIANEQNFAGSLLQSNLSLSELKLGFRTKLNNIPMGTIVNNISQGLTGHSQYARSAGTSAQLIQLDKKYAKLKLPSSKILKVSVSSYATIGVVSNNQHNLTYLGKAGRSRNLNRRPIVRGIAMNPVDHPHGGRTNGGRPSVTPWGLPTKSKFYLKKRTRKKHEQI
jgi:large subunit ribosomal protein L2